MSQVERTNRTLKKTVNLTLQIYLLLNIWGLLLELAKGRIRSAKHPSKSIFSVKFILPIFMFIVLVLLYLKRISYNLVTVQRYMWLKEENVLHHLKTSNKFYYEYVFKFKILKTKIILLSILIFIYVRYKLYKSYFWCWTSN